MMRRLVLVLLAIMVPALASAADSIRVRVGEHSGFNRLVFDWERNVGYTVDRQPGRVVVRFAAPADIDLSRFRKDPSPLVRDIAVNGDGVATEIVLMVDDGVTSRHFRDGTRVAIDLMSASAARPEAKAPAASFEESKKAPSGVAQPKPVETKGAGVATAEVKLAAKVPPALSPPVVLKPAAEARPTLVPVVNRNSVLFPFTEPAAVAVFRRAGRVWIAFDRAVRIDDAPLAAAGAAPWGGAIVAPSPGGSFVSFAAPEDTPVALEEKGAVWVLSFGVDEGAGAPALDVHRDAYAGGGPRIVVPAIEPSAAIVFTDPAVGDRLIVVPVRGPGRVEDRRDFTQLVLLPTVQGVVIEPLDDGIDVRSAPDLVEVTVPGGLILSGGRRTAGDSAYARPVIFRFDDWRGRPGVPFIEARQEMFRRVAAATPAGRNAARLDLARFFFAHGQAAETLAVLGRIARDDPAAERGTAFRALRGAALLEQGNPARAAADLSHPSLDNDPEMALWRGRLAAAQDEWPAAEAAFRYGSEALSAYPPERRAAFRLPLIRAYLKAENPGAANAELDAIRRDVTSEAQEAEAGLLRGETALQQGDRPAAKTAFAASRASTDRRVRVQGELDALDLALAMKEIEPAEAVERLEKLRYAWRGDSLEFEVLRKLGLQQIAAADVRSGLATLKQAMTLFPKHPDKAAVARDMGEAFADLFIGDAGDRLPPLQALALHQEFRELTPAGPQGDAVIARLADRLVAVDLLDRAAALLENQVKFRLQGEGKARVGARLAVVYLLDRKPAEALKALAASALNGMSPATAAERRLLEARAQADLGQFNLALAALGDDRSADALAQRADILWRARDWPRAASALEAVLADKAVGAAALLPADRRRVLQLALAASLANDAGKLAAVRDQYRARMTGSPEGDAFTLATDTPVDEGTQARRLAGAIAQAGQIEAFMASYREKLAKGGLSAVN